MRSVNEYIHYSGHRLKFHIHISICLWHISCQNVGSVSRGGASKPCHLSIKNRHISDVLISEKLTILRYFEAYVYIIVFYEQ